MEEKHMSRIVYSRISLSFKPPRSRKINIYRARVYSVVPDIAVYIATLSLSLKLSARYGHFNENNGRILASRRTLSLDGNETRERSNETHR